MSKTTVRVALDWTPNTLHSGLYLALAQNFYADAGLDVHLLPPSDDDYTLTPAKRLASGAADLALCPSESCIAYAEARTENASRQGNKTGHGSDGADLHLQAVYAILQKDASAIVATKPEFASLKQLGAGGVYGSYNARYEDRIVRAMVGRAGGDAQGMRIASDVGKLSLFEALRAGTVDATWVFLPWEGVEAEMEGVGLHVFRTEEYGVPYGHSPVIARNAAGGLDEDVLRRFVAATRKGYRAAVERPAEAAAVLEGHCSPSRSMAFLEKSQERISGYYGDVEKLGRMDGGNWSRWLEWLRAQDLLKAEEVKAEDLFTNEFCG